MRFSICLIWIMINCHGYGQGINYESPNKYRFAYKSQVFKGPKHQINQQLSAIKEHPNYQSIPEEIRIEINKLFIKTKEQVYPKKYKKRAIVFLEAIDNYKEFIIFYNTNLYGVIRKLRRDINKIDFQLEREFTKAKVAHDRIEKEKISDLEEINRLRLEYTNSHTRLLCHRWMREKFDDYKTNQSVEDPDALILEFKKQQAAKMWASFQENKEANVSNYLENEIIDYYYKTALTDIDPAKLELEYINKI